jgi:hypothetical protein
VPSFFQAYLRRALFALPFAVLVVVGAIVYQVFFGRFRPQPVCWAELDRKGLRYSQVGGFFETLCVRELEALKVKDPTAYACGARCVVRAENTTELEACARVCPGWVDPLGTTK